MSRGSREGATALLTSPQLIDQSERLMVVVCAKRQLVAKRQLTPPAGQQQLQNLLLSGCHHEDLGVSCAPVGHADQLLTWSASRRPLAVSMQRFEHRVGAAIGQSRAGAEESLQIFFLMRNTNSSVFFCSSFLNLVRVKRDEFLFLFCFACNTYQKARGIVLQATKANDEVSFELGRTFSCVFVVVVHPSCVVVVVVVVVYEYKAANEKWFEC